MLIETEVQLREIIGHPMPSTREKKFPNLIDTAREFIATSPFLILATADANGSMDASPKGDGPGFVQWDEDGCLLIPERKGNRLADGHLNILHNDQVALIFLRPNTRETLRINGRAELRCEPDVLERLSARGQPALIYTRVHVEECFVHCGKALIRSELWNPESWGDVEKVSFGKMYVERSGADASVADVVDRAIEQDYIDNL
jgi:hypothetical protein